MRRYLSLLVLLSFVTLTTAQTVRTVTVTPAGQGGTYNSLSAAEDGADALPDLVARDEILVIEIDGDWSGGPDTSAVTFQGFITDATRKIIIRTVGQARHAGKWDATKYVLATTDVTALTLSDDFIDIDGLQIQVTTTASQAAAAHGITVASVPAGSTFLWENIIVKGIISGSSGNFARSGLRAADSDGSYTIRNCVVFDFTAGSANLSSGITMNAGGNVYNCTVHNSEAGFTRIAGSPVMVNNLARSCTAAASGTFAAGTDYNATDLSSMGYTVTGGGNTHDRLSQTFTFVDESGDDFHLASNDAGARDFGFDLSGSFTTDIDGQTRTGSWDIGADEYVAGGAPTKKDAGFFFP